MITKEEIQHFETILTELTAGLKASVMAELEKMGLPPDTFLQEISQPIEVVQDEPEQTTGLPNLEGVGIPENEIELPFLEKGTDGWKGLIKHVMTNNITSEIPRVGAKFQLSEKNWQYLKDIVFYKSELFSGNFTALQIHSQGLDKEDWHYFTEMEETLKSLK